MAYDINADDAAWWLDNKAKFWNIQFKIKDWVNDNGPLRLTDGRVIEILPDGFDYDADLMAEEVPDLVTHLKIPVSGPRADMDRALSILSEEVPALEIGEIEYIVDKLGAKRAMKYGSPELIAKLNACIKPKGKLGQRK